MGKLFHALEELNVDKVAALQDPTNASSALDLLHHEKQAVELNEKLKADIGSTPVDDSSEPAIDDPGGDETDIGSDDPPVDDPDTPEEPSEDTPPDEPEEVKKDAPKKDEKEKPVKEDPPAEEETAEEKPAQESLRNLSVENYALEWDDTGVLGTVSSVVGGVWTAAKTSSAFIYGSIAAVTMILAGLGIKYGPGLAEGLYKGVIYAFCKTVKLTQDSSVAITKYLDRRINSFANIQTAIRDLNKILSDIEAKNTDIVKPEGSYSNVKVIDALKINNSVAIADNVNVMEKFLGSIVKGIGAAVKKDMGYLKYMLSVAGNNGAVIPTSVLAVKPLSSDFRASDVPGYTPDNELLECFVFKDTLPSNIVCVAHIPATSVKTTEDFISSYGEARIFLGVGDSYTEVKSIDYMDINGLKELLKSLDKVCSLCISHQSLYEDIERDKRALKYSFKGYFMKLANSKEKVSLKSSLVQQIHLKTLFTDKVYLVAAMDVHDYAIKVLTAGLSFVKDNIQKLE